MANALPRDGMPSPFDEIARCAPPSPAAEVVAAGAETRMGSKHAEQHTEHAPVSEALQNALAELVE